MDAAAPPKIKFTTHRTDNRDGNNLLRAQAQMIKDGAEVTYVTLPSKSAAAPAAPPAPDQLIKEPPRRSTTSLKAISDEDAETADQKGAPGKPTPTGLKKKIGGWFKK